MDSIKAKDLIVVTLWAEDVKATAHFYLDVLGLELLPGHHGRGPVFKLGDVHLLILAGKPQPPLNPEPERFPVIAFSVEDIDRAAVKLKQASVELPWGVEQSPDSRWIMFHDPAGNLIELAELNEGGGVID